ncbi:MAG: rRNA maturation RNase YbeY [Candidatus Aminicenantales bacterium]
MIEIINRQRKHPLRRTKIKSLVERLAARYGFGEAEIALVFTGERAIRTLNRTYRGKDRPTDVLSFPLGKKGADDCFYLGDIVVSVPVAARQARTRGHSLDRELEILIVHGFLHLAGHDHGDDISSEEKAVRKEYFGEDA